MELTFSFKTAHDLFEKLKRDADLLLNDEISSDRLFNFVVTGYSIIDWVRNDLTVPQVFRERARPKGSETGNLYAEHWLQVCGDLATACKHFDIVRRQKAVGVITESTSSSKGFGLGRIGMGKYGCGEEEIWVRLLEKGSASPHDIAAGDLINNVLQVWRRFFDEVEAGGKYKDHD